MEIIQTGNEIISPTSRPKIKKLILRNVSHLIQGGSKFDFENRKPIYPKQQSFLIDIFQLYLCPSLATINTTMIQQVKTGNGIIQTDNLIISPTSRPLEKFPICSQVFKIYF